MACSSLINKLEQPVRLEPLSRFPVIRDLAVDRSVLFENLKRVRAWVPVDGTYDLGAGLRISPKAQEEMYPLSRCISCCCPFGIPKIVPEYDQMLKCDMCYDRTSEGKRPMCATVCPSQALAYVRPEEIAHRREKPTNVSSSATSRSRPKSS